MLRVPLIRWFRMDGRTAALRRIDEPSGGRSLLQGYRDLRQFEWVPMPDGGIPFLPPQAFKPAESTPHTGSAPAAPSPK